MTKLLSGAALLVAAAFSQASPVLWTLQGAVFSDGGLVTGSFVYDASSNVYTNVLLSSSATGNTYLTGDQSAVPFGVDATGIEVIEGHVANNDLGKDVMNLDFTAALTDLGGVVALVTGFPSFEGHCLSNGCSSGSILREIVSGSVVAAAVPAPATLAIVGLGLLGLAATRRRV